MFNQISESVMHRVRWFLTCTWLLLIASLLYDPISPLLSNPDYGWSPFRLDPDRCVQVQGACLSELPYPIGAPIFWGMIVPASILILLVFGHELWRRICPLSFLSQLPVALKWQRRHRRGEKAGKVRYEIVRIKKESWLGRNHLYVQFSWLFVGLCARILFVNSDRWALAAWLLLTIGAAIATGYLYGGKSWCNYFCPMAPVQKIYAEPGGLLVSQAHVDENPMTQSMCRTINDDGNEQSACVACKSPCIDIDAERSYWDGVSRADHQLLYYSYVGLVVGYFVYYYLYAGNWDYYFSGVWAYQTNQLDTLFDPGFYLWQRPIPIPKLIAVPLTLGGFTWAGLTVGKAIESVYGRWLKHRQISISSQSVRHQLFTLCTFGVFNLFFVFAGRPFILLLPPWMQYGYDTLIVGASTLWLYRTWRRSPDLYSRESLASRFRKQLHRLSLDVSRFMEGRSLDDLNTHEIYVLAKVLPGFTKEKRHQAYKGVLRDALEEGYVNTTSSLEVLGQLRLELDISDEEHHTVLTELGVEDPELLNPSRLRDRENLVRLNGYRKAMERLLLLQQRQFNWDNLEWETNPTSSQQAINTLLTQDLEAVRMLRRDYSITPQEDDQVLADLNATAGLVRRSHFLLNQLENLVNRYRALNQPIVSQQRNVLTLLRATVQQQKRLLVMGLLEILEQLGTTSDGHDVAKHLGKIAPVALQELLDGSTLGWRSRLSADLLILLENPEENGLSCSLELEAATIADHLDALLWEPNPLIQTTSLYMLHQVDPDRAAQQAMQLLSSTASIKPLVQETAAIVLAHPHNALKPLSAFATLEKLVYLFNSDFFNGTRSDTLIALAQRSTIRSYDDQSIVTEEGDTCRELLVLIEGSAQIDLRSGDRAPLIQHLLPGQVLDELEVLSHREQAGTIIATAPQTRILAIPVDTFDDLLDYDHDFARRVLEMESQRLQQLLHRGDRQSLVSTLP